MPTHSAGLLLYRVEPGGGTAGEPDRAPGRRLQVLLVHPGGPYWARRDEGCWSIPKGEVRDGEDQLAAAEREVAEELGIPAPSGERIPLGEVVQAGGKHVQAWAVAGDLDVSVVESGTFELEWPPRSGRLQSFPEVDRAGWFGLDDAREKILPGQQPLLDRLQSALVRAPVAREAVAQAPVARTDGAT